MKIITNNELGIVFIDGTIDEVLDYIKERPDLTPYKVQFFVPHYVNATRPELGGVYEPNMREDSLFYPNIDFDSPINEDNINEVEFSSGLIRTQRSMEDLIKPTLAREEYIRDILKEYKR